MRKFRFDKLVRDKIVEKTNSSGDKAYYKKLSKKEHIKELKNKLLEEIKELETENREEFMEEIADLQEIIDVLMKLSNISKSDVIIKQTQKNEMNGSFFKGEYIEYVELRETSPWVKRFLKNPEKYPEIK